MHRNTFYPIILGNLRRWTWGPARKRGGRLDFAGAVNVGMQCCGVVHRILLALT